MTFSSSSFPPNGGVLDMVIVSLNHLPTREAPSHVSLQACGQTSVTGPPSRRHKDQNSFQFTTSTNSNPTNNRIKIQTKSLQSLYETKFLLRVVYDNDPSRNLKATLAAKKLGIHQVHHLLLELELESSHTAKIQPTTEGIYPSLELHAQLSGDYRREIQHILRLSKVWFTVVDALEQTVVRFIPANNNSIIAALVVALLLTPLIGMVLLVVSLIFPVLALVLSAGAGLALGFLLLIASTSQGRRYWQAPWIAQSPVAQRVLYPIGPRPTPVDAVELLVPHDKWAKLLLSLIIDFIGGSSYLVPFWGEAFDLAWAPLQTLLLMAMYNKTSPKLKYLSFLEELLPFTDAVPSATIGWLAQYGPQWIVGGTDTLDPLPDDLQLKED